MCWYKNCLFRPKTVFVDFAFYNWEYRVLESQEKSSNSSFSWKSRESQGEPGNLTLGQEKVRECYSWCATKFSPTSCTCKCPLQASKFSIIWIGGHFRKGCKLFGKVVFYSVICQIFSHHGWRNWVRTMSFYSMIWVWYLKKNSNWPGHFPNLSKHIRNVRWDRSRW